MRRRIRNIILMLSCAIILALVPFPLILQRMTGLYMSHNGPWRTNLATGSVEAGPYLRAFVALRGLFALEASESMYYLTESDSNGEVLKGNCTYRIEGSDLDARWWSLTAYAQDGFLIPNPQKLYSYSKHNIEYNAEGVYTIVLSPTEQPRHWLPSAGAEEVQLLLRLYNPAPTVYQNVTTIELPRIVKEGC